jgi:hypothetical protein
MSNKYANNPVRDAFIEALNAFYVSCGEPPYGIFAEYSKRLGDLYPDPHGRESLHGLSKSAVCETLAGRRKSLPTPAWLASFVLCCQRLAYEAAVITEDPGTSTLPGWQSRLRAAKAEEGRSGTSQPTDLPSTQDSPSADVPDRPETPARFHPEIPYPSRSADEPRPADAARLPASQHDYVAGYGPYGQALLAKLRAGDPDAVYRVALILGVGPGHGDETLTLLIRAAVAEHSGAIDLLDASPVHLNRKEAAAHAYGLALAAKAEGATETALLFYDCAVRYGSIGAVANPTTAPRATSDQRQN